MKPIISTMLLILVGGIWIKSWQELDALAHFVRGNFERDYQVEACGSMLALSANLEAALLTWDEQACAGAQLAAASRHVLQLLEARQALYPALDPQTCSAAGSLQIFLRQQQHPDLAPSYPNWVVQYAKDA